jgi:large subunit ribosomal protein L9
MKIILLEDIANLGKIGEVVVVKAGYARNFLMPTGKARRATKENIAEFETKRATYETKQNQKLADAKARYEQINDKVFVVAAKAGVDGKLFGSVSTLDIVDAVKAGGVEIKKAEVTMPNGPLKTIGEFDISVILHHDVHANIKVNVTALA